MAISLPNSELFTPAAPPVLKSELPAPNTANSTPAAPPVLKSKLSALNIVKFYTYSTSYLKI